MSKPLSPAEARRLSSEHSDNLYEAVNPKTWNAIRDAALQGLTRAETNLEESEIFALKQIGYKADMIFQLNSPKFTHYISWA